MVYESPCGAPPCRIMGSTKDGDGRKQAGFTHLQESGKGKYIGFQIYPLVNVHITIEITFFVAKLTINGHGDSSIGSLSSPVTNG